jgi:tetratricopeptide (TPR) repeat protein
METEISNTENKVSERYVDSYGFVRKRRNNLGILLWIGVEVANEGMRSIPNNLGILALLSWPISAYLMLIAIQMESSHDIETWKGTSNVKVWVFLGNLFAGLLGLIIYEFLKKREKSYLKKTPGLVESSLPSDLRHSKEHNDLEQTTKEDLNIKGNNFFDREEYFKAIEFYDMAIGKDPEYTNAWLNKGTALYKLDIYDKALEAYNEAIKINPQLAIAWNRKGYALKKLDRNADAVDAFAKAKELGYSG